MNIGPDYSIRTGELLDQLTTENGEQQRTELTTEQLSQVLVGKGSFASKSHQAVGMLRERLPHEFQRLDVLLDAHGAKLDSLREGGWHAQKNQGDMTAIEEDGLSYEVFRKEVVDVVTDITLAMVRELGFSDPGRYSATGTPGWNSDVDTVYLAASDVPEEVQMITKTLFDMIFLEEFGALPGFLFDTESYLNHAAMALNTAAQVTTEEGQMALNRLELSATALQMIRQSGGRDSEGWHAFTEQVRSNYSADDPSPQHSKRFSMMWKGLKRPSNQGSLSSS